MKLKTVSTYQTVRFNNRDERHFDVAIPRFAGIEMNFNASKGFVELKLADKDLVYVFPANIAYIVPEAAEQSQPEAKKSKA